VIDGIHEYFRVHFPEDFWSPRRSSSFGLSFLIGWLFSCEATNLLQEISSVTILRGITEFLEKGQQTEDESSRPISVPRFQNQ
jgi:hypothetical protein